MVMFHAAGSNFFLLAESSTPTGLERLDPPTRARVIMALLGLVLLGVTLVACVMIGGRWVRRLARHSPHSMVPRGLASRAVDSKTPIAAVAGPTDDTLIGQQRMDETRTD